MAPTLTSSCSVCLPRRKPDAVDRPRSTTYYINQVMHKLFLESAGSLKASKTTSANCSFGKESPNGMGAESSVENHQRLPHPGTGTPPLPSPMESPASLPATCGTPHLRRLSWQQNHPVPRSAVTRGQVARQQGPHTSPSSPSSGCCCPLPHTGTHPGGNLIYRVAPPVSLGLGDSVEAGQIGAPLPGGGHPPATSAAAAACGVASGKPGAEALRVPRAAAKQRGGGGSTAAPLAHDSASGLAEELPGRASAGILKKGRPSFEFSVATRPGQVREGPVVVPPLSSLRRPEASPRSHLAR